jgi:hypothetical protein
MKKNIMSILVLSILAMACVEPEVEKIVLPGSDVAGEYIVHLELTQPFAASDEQVIRIFNTASLDADSSWLEDHDFFESQVKVRWTDAYNFSAESGKDVLHGEVVNITGRIFPETDSIHVEWRYLQGGAPEADYVVIGKGVRYNGLTN